MDEHIAAEEQKLAALAARGIHPLTVYNRFVSADMSEEYRSMYNFLSCDAHSNIRALISRHAELNATDFEVVYYRNEPLEIFQATLDSAAGLLIDASLLVHEAYSSEGLPAVKRMKDELDAVRTKYVA